MGLISALLIPNAQLKATSDQASDDVERVIEAKEALNSAARDRLRKIEQDLGGLSREAQQVASSVTNISKRLERSAAEFGALTESVLSNLDPWKADQAGEHD